MAEKTRPQWWPENPYQIHTASGNRDAYVWDAATEAGVKAVIELVETLSFGAWDEGNLVLDLEMWQHLRKEAGLDD